MLGLLSGRGSVWRGKIGVENQRTIRISLLYRSITPVIYTLTEKQLQEYKAPRRPHQANVRKGLKFAILRADYPLNLNIKGNHCNIAARSKDPPMMTPGRS
jgi:hypothetical protein